MRGSHQSSVRVKFPSLFVRSKLDGDGTRLRSVGCGGPTAVRRLGCCAAAPGVVSAAVCGDVDGGGPFFALRLSAEELLLFAPFADVEDCFLCNGAAEGDITSPSPSPTPSPRGGSSGERSTGCLGDDGPPPAALLLLSCKCT